jgi:hypothetical protein
MYVTAEMNETENRKMMKIPKLSIFKDKIDKSSGRKFKERRVSINQK